jgi:sugar phosphate isomerase/epimerase
MTPILSYCMNVHPGETTAELIDLLRGPAARVRAAWRGEEPMGAGLWLPLASAREIATSVDAAARVRDALSEAGLFAFTANAFPLGGFHDARVKEAVYQPTWLEAERLEFTRHACRALARLLPEGARGSVSTVPVGYKAFGQDDRFAEAGANLARLADFLLELEAETGKEISLALEPEPLASLETTAEAIAFLEAHVFSAGARGSASEADVRRLIGVCVDTCHLACEFEHIPTSLRDLERAGVRVVKGQLSSALELREPATNAAGRERLASFDEPRYLHQTVGQTDSGELIRANDLPDFLASDAFGDATVARTHFHVPLSWGGDAVLGTTRAVLEEGLAALARATDHLEVETYTFAVLPEADRARYGDDVVNMIAAELRWVDERLP